MILAIDVGNTNITIGVYVSGKITAHWRLSSRIARTEDELWGILKTLTDAEELSLREVRGVAMGSVVPAVLTVLNRLMKKRFSIPFVEVNATTRTGIVNRYADPGSVGADRICNAVAGFAKYGGPLVVVDFGTATTFDVVSAKAEYVGGVIAPGLESAVSAMHRFAARLPQVDLRFPDEVIGKTTEASMQSGLMFGGTEMVEGLIRRLKGELGQETRVVATGGLAEVLLPHLPGVEKVEPFLTLDGLYRIFVHNHADPTA